MNGQDGHDPFGGQNKASAILVTLVIASFAVCTLYIAYRQLNRCLEGRGSLDPPLTISASTIALGQRPILWDVHIQKEKVGWRGWKPLSAASEVLYAPPTLPRTQNPSQGFSGGQETVHVSVIIVLPSQRKQELDYMQVEEVGDWAIGITAVRCRGSTRGQ
ncbi:hypothetical protein BJ322DRAFT_668272 [Thelephora terrestris]|uniref:Uncharacterized protein n=1 Tax=Thelephora terrestris TaxID=56493 RepID=A0A9P6HJK6_9AGAM|nr:hypothetical protein BJ322DRAFT_668272 [Thelephora terrestris]